MILLNDFGIILLFSFKIYGPLSKDKSIIAFVKCLRIYLSIFLVNKIEKIFEKLKI